MTSDGRRRITPIFILPTSDNSNQTNSMNGNSSTDSFGKYQMQSSSSESKSKIVIEKLNGIVEPNVSPGKKSSSPVNDKPSSGAAPAPKPNMIAVKHKPGHGCIIFGKIIIFPESCFVRSFKNSETSSKF